MKQQTINYTHLYNKIYSAIKTDDIPHDKAHRSALRIADAINDIYIYTNVQYPDKLDDILDTVEFFCNAIRLGGYDLDDKGNPL